MPQVGLHPRNVPPVSFQGIVGIAMPQGVNGIAAPVQPRPLYCSRELPINCRSVQRVPVVRSSPLMCGKSIGERVDPRLPSCSPVHLESIFYFWGDFHDPYMIRFAFIDGDFIAEPLEIPGM